MAAFSAAGLFGPGAVSVRAQQEPENALERAPRLVVDSVVVRGNVRQQSDLIVGTTNILRGDTVDYRGIQNAIRRLWKTGLFSDVKVYADGEQGNTHGFIVVDVKEAPFLAAIEFRGLEHVDGKQIADTVGLRSGTPFSAGKTTEVEDRVRAKLASKGFHVRKLEHKLEPMENMPGEFRLVFDVEEGRRVAIADIVFEGNSVYSDDELRGAMETKSEGFLWFRNGQLDDARLTADLKQNLPNYYGAGGYIDMAVLGDSVAVDPATGKARLIVTVDEGQKYDLASFDIRGNHHFPSEELKRYFEAEDGGLLSGLGGGNDSTKTTFDKAAFDKATERISQLYRNQGYLYARVEPVIVRDTAGGRRVVNASWEITEGSPAYVNRVTVVGNTFTHERVVREQILLLPGDVYNEDLLIQSYRNISGLGFFEAPLPMPKIEPNEKGDVDLTFEVKEKQTGSINFGTALGGGTGVAGFLGYDQPNLFGQAKSGHLRWEFGKYQNNLEASYTDPSLKQSLISGSVSLFSTRDRFFRFAEGQQRRTGAALRFGLPLPSDRSGRTRLFLGYSLSRTTYEQFERDTDSSIFGLPPGIQSTVTLSLVRNTLDSPLFPTVGTKQEFSVDLNGGPLGGDAKFQRYSLAGSWFVPVGSIGGGSPGARPLRFTLGVNSEAGALFGNASRFPFQRFWLGGVQFGKPLRGYEETTITPFGYFAKGDTAIALEDRLGDAFFRVSTEFAMRFNDNLSLSLFYDAGNIWKKAAEINPTRLMRGAGVGVTLITPFGPLGLDYAYGFDKTNPGWQLHFKFGGGF